ncbi:DUF3782 domain-containing protein, partial [Candidatus Poribacteria bacterium]|nr:DUF3782 domain-containing protein [Candidatus Poribacteria bacterium]
MPEYEELAQLQKRIEDRLERIEAALEKLRLAQESLERTLESKIGALETWCGLSTEGTFREAMQGILRSLGFQVEPYLKLDPEGEVYGWPDQVELDIVIQNGTLIVIEIKASMSKSEVATFHRKLRFYEEQEEKTVNRRLIVSPFVDSPA